MLSSTGRAEAHLQALTPSTGHKIQLGARPCHHFYLILRDSSRTGRLADYCKHADIATIVELGMQDPRMWVKHVEGKVHTFSSAGVMI
jgi:hypothetical protein